MSRLLLICALIVATALGASPGESPFAFAQLGGWRGNAYVKHQTGDAYGYGEDVALTFTHALAPKSFQASYAISPATPSSIYSYDYGRQVIITMRKVPGVTYTISVAPTLQDNQGEQLGKALSVQITTPANVQIPKPIKATPNEPYRYGVLEHPFPFSLGGIARPPSSNDYQSAVRQFALLYASGARFVRIDYCGDATEPSSGTFNWSTEDAIMDRLAAHGITELPIIDQYCAPKWATGGKGYPAVWSEPSDYAAFAAAVAAHVSQRYPTITRIELFNEPNLHGWWTNGNPQYASRSGGPTAVYMKAAYAAIKRVAPKMTIVGPALADGGWDTDPRKFLQAMYDNGCKTGVCWDVLSVHNYRWYNPTYQTKASYQNQWDIYRQLQAICVKNGDPKPHVMLTEWGFSNADMPVGFDPRVQARYVALGFNLMLSDPTVDGIVYVNLYNPAKDFWGHTALVGANFQALPAYNVFKEFAQ